MNQKRVSLKDLAEELGISISSVSRALQDSPEVGEELKQRVRALANERHYRPNPFARGLRREAPKVIGVITPSMNTHYHSSVIAGIEEEAQRNGYSVICCNSHENVDTETQCLENLYNMHVDGVIVCISQQTTDESVFEKYTNLNFPIVFYARTCMYDKVSSVVSDDVIAATKATEHLIHQGCKRIGFVGGPNHLDMVRRRKHGFIEALHEARMEVTPTLFKSGNLDRATAYDSAKALIKNEHVDGLITINYDGLFGALDALREEQKRIPEDVAIISFIDDPDVRYLTPSISSIVDESFNIGIHSCRLLLDKIHGNNAITHRVLPMHIHIRNSSQRLSTQDV